MMRNVLFAFLIFGAGIGTVCSQKPGLKIPEMILVAGGSFQMGCDTGKMDEKPVHKVTLSSFYLGKYEITLGDFKKFIVATGYKTDAEQPDSVRVKNGLPPRSTKTASWNMYATGMPVSADDSLYPVGYVSWNDAVAYCQWLSRETGKNFRLPTEAEWEFAARGGIKARGYIYAGSNTLDDAGWYLQNSRARAHPTAQKMPNELGLYDMTGNSLEWCSDWYSASWYQTSPEKNPAGPAQGTLRVMRGGSWRSFETHMRITCRNSDLPHYNSMDTGFRVAMTDDAPVKKK